LQCLPAIIFREASVGYKPLRRNDGFTLVEVLVITVIVAILAAVAFPLYLNHVISSRNQVALSAAGGIATFCAACVNGGGTVGGISATAQNNFTITCTGGSGDQTSIQVPPQLNASVSSLTSPSTVTVTNTATGVTAQTVKW
jgi:prepilin-type N-terminal cleavage/methylation domain-containing protein